MLKLTYIAVEGYEPAIVLIKTNEVDVQKTHVKYFDPDIGLVRSVGMDKLDKVEFKVNVDDEIKSMAKSTADMLKMRKKTYSNATIR